MTGDISRCGIPSRPCSRTHAGLSVLASTALVVLTALTGCDPKQDPAPGPLQVDFNADDAQLSVTATDIPIDEFLTELERTHDIIVRVAELEPYNVSGSYGPATIRDVLSDILQGRRFSVRIGEHGVPLPGSHTGERAPASAYVGPPDPHRPEIRVGTSHARLIVDITPVGVFLQAFRQRTGPAVHHPQSKGDLVYVATVAGQPVWVGTLRDPLVLHEHHVHESSEAFEEGHAHVHITVPEPFLDPAVLESSAAVRFYRADDGTMPDYLTLDMVDALMPGWAPLGEIDSAALFAAYGEWAQQVAAAREGNSEFLPYTPKPLPEWASLGHGTNGTFQAAPDPAAPQQQAVPDVCGDTMMNPIPAATRTQIQAGPAMNPKTLVVIGDGFTAEDASAFDTWVTGWIEDGRYLSLVGQDKSQYTIWKVSVASAESGLSRYNGTELVESNKTALCAATKDAGFNGPADSTRLNTVLVNAGFVNGVSDVDYTVVVGNTDQPSNIYAGGSMSVTPSWSSDSCFNSPVPAVTTDNRLELIHSGDQHSDQKLDLLIVGEGFSANDQLAYQQYVNRFIMNGMFQHDAFAEDMNSFNIWLATIPSTESGISRKDASGWTWKKTWLCMTTDVPHFGYWVWTNAGGPQTVQDKRLLEVINSPSFGLSWDKVIVLINEPDYQGGGSNTHNIFWQNTKHGLDPNFAAGVAEGWLVAQHEMGHMLGGLGDEYVTRGADSVHPPHMHSWPNLTLNGTIADLPPLWAQFVDRMSSSLVHAAASEAAEVAGWSNFQKNQIAGLWEGGDYYAKNVYRPVYNSRMRDARGGCPDECAVFDALGYTRMRSVMRSHSSYSYDAPVTGDFDGDGADDLVLHFANSILLYRSGRGQDDQYELHFEKGITGPVPGATPGTPTWTVHGEDQLYAGDFTGDGKTDLLAVYAPSGGVATERALALLESTGTTFQVRVLYQETLPGAWALDPADRVLVQDLDHDGAADFIIHSATSMALYRSVAASGAFTELRQDALYNAGNPLPGWGAPSAGDAFLLGRFSGASGRGAVLYAFNQASGALGMMTTGTGNPISLTSVARYQGSLGAWSDLGTIRTLVPGDFNGDGRDDVVVFDHDLAPDDTSANTDGGALGVFLAVDSGLAASQVYQDTVTSTSGARTLQLHNHDRFWAADANGDGKDDLIVFNGRMEQPSLNILDAADTGFAVQQAQLGTIDFWDMGRADRFLAADFTGDGKSDLFAISGGDGFRSLSSTPLADNYTRWLGLLGSNGMSFSADAVYPGWINNTAYQKNQWW